MLNYISAFLTFRCNMHCSYCINHYGDFRPRKEIDAYKWGEILKSLPNRDDLPITLGGGEPTLHPGFFTLLYELENQGKKVDLLTNGMFDVEEFISLTSPGMFRSGAPYASIRFSFHKTTNEEKLVKKVLMMQKAGYHVGIWGIGHPNMAERNKDLAAVCLRKGIDYREKE